MTARVMLVGCAAALLALSGAATTGPARAQGPDLGSDAQRESGRQLYQKYCSQCHGDKGDGEGYATPHLFPKPRNFTTGTFKIRTTPSGALPTHQDLVNIIKRGMPYTSMPAWPNLSEGDVSNLAYYIKTFSAEFANPANAPQPVSLPDAPRATTETAAQGKKLYEETGCARCHGNLGRGDGPSAPTLTDDWGQAIRPADLTQRWTFRGGPTREDIFRTMTTGINGTPMPSFLEGLQPEQRWAITDYIASLSSGELANYNNLVIAKHVQAPIDPAKGAASFAAAPVARFPIIGQIMEPGRAFHPPTVSVAVQAIYDADSVAILVRWNDMSAEKSGKNAPSMPVPPEEDEWVPPARGAGSAAGTKDDPFADAAAPAPAGQPQDPFADPEPAAAKPSEFSDAVSIQIPSQPPVDARKPYFIFGDAQSPVDLWFFDLAGDKPLQFTGKGSTDITASDTGEVTGVASYDQGEWSVVFKRPLRAKAGPAFSPGEFLPVAFSVWDGFSRERGNRRGLTPWYSIYMEPQNVPSAIGPMARTALIILALELAVIGYVRWRHGAGSLGQVSPKRA